MKNRVVAIGAVVAVLTASLVAQVVRSPATQFPSVAIETNGSAGSPSLHWVNSPTKGFYRFDSNGTGISGHLIPGADATYDLGSSGNKFRNGYFSGSVTAGGAVTFPDGSSGSPSITFTSQTTTGFYRQGSAQIGVAGSLLFVDATFDLGAAAATRPRNGFFSNILAGAKVQVGAGAATSSNITLRSSDAAGRVSVMLGDESAKGDVYANAFNGISYQMTPGAASQPACNSSNRGTFWYAPGGAGVFDLLQFCGKGDDDSYNWYQVFFF